jgi:hypothetical protein
MRAIPWLAGLLMVASTPAPAAPGQQYLYQRVEQRLAADPGLASRLGQVGPEMEAVAWMIGTWEVDTVVEGREQTPGDHGNSVVTQVFGGVWLEIRDTYPSGTQDISYLGFSAAEGRWVSLGLDSLANANRVTATGWRDGALVFEGDFLVLGLPAHLRQVIARAGDDEYTLTNEERIGDEWRMLDRYRYRRRSAGS